MSSKSLGSLHFVRTTTTLLYLEFSFMPHVSKLVDIFGRMENHTNSTLANWIEAEQDTEINYGQTLGMIDLLHGRLGLACT